MPCCSPSSFKFFSGSSDYCASTSRKTWRTVPYVFSVFSVFSVSSVFSVFVFLYVFVFLENRPLCFQAGATLKGALLWKLMVPRFKEVQCSVLIGCLMHFDSCSLSLCAAFPCTAFMMYHPPSSFILQSLSRTSFTFIMIAVEGRLMKEAV